jgi:hypothetical protein
LIAAFDLAMTSTPLNYVGLREVVWVFLATSERWKHACEHLEPQIFLVAYVSHKPSHRAVYDLLQTGSYTTITRYLRTWKPAEEIEVPVAPDTVEKSVQVFAADMWQSALIFYYLAGLRNYYPCVVINYLAAFIFSSCSAPPNLCV